MNLTLVKNFILILGMICMLNMASFDFALAQNQDSGINNERENIEKKIDEFDGLLTPNVTATLTGLALAGASFLVRDTTNDSRAIFINSARKNLIKSFLFFLSCLISIFVFDAIEILINRLIVPLIILDTITTYGLFGTGCVTLVKGAKGIYSSFVKS